MAQHNMLEFNAIMCLIWANVSVFVCVYVSWMIQHHECSPNAPPKYQHSRSPTTWQTFLHFPIPFRNNGQQHKNTSALRIHAKRYPRITWISNNNNNLPVYWPRTGAFFQSQSSECIVEIVPSTVSKQLDGTCVHRFSCSHTRNHVPNCHFHTFTFAQCNNYNSNGASTARTAPAASYERNITQLHQQHRHTTTISITNTSVYRPCVPFFVRYHGCVCVSRLPSSTFLPPWMVVVFAAASISCVCAYVVFARNFPYSRIHSLTSSNNTISGAMYGTFYSLAPNEYIV